MANETFYPVRSARSELIEVYDNFVGNGSSAPTLPNSGKFAQEILTCTRTGTGAFTLTFKHKFPTLKFQRLSVMGTTAGLDARFLTLDVAAGTATLLCEVAGTATDPASTDLVYMHLAVRNSGRNK